MNDKSVIEHYERWVGNPQVGALTLAITCRMRGLRLCQTVAEYWFELMAGILQEKDSRNDYMERYSEVRKWAGEVCKRRKWPELAKCNDGLCIAVARELFRYLSRLAKLVGERKNVLINTRWFVRRYVRQCLPHPVILELEELARGFQKQKLLSYVNPSPSASLASLSVTQEKETICALEEMRVRPHRLRAQPVSNERLEHGQLRVAQVVQEGWTHSKLGARQIDTINDDNPDLPFWPQAACNSDQQFSHRCAVHEKDDALEWTDWPQVTTQVDVKNPPIWRFVTGLFKLTDVKGITHYDLVGRTEWGIDWTSNQD